MRTKKELLEERDALLAEKEENNQILADCKAQIDRAIADKQAGYPRDNDWYQAVKTRARYAGLRDQEIARTLNSLSSELRSLSAAENPPIERLTLRDHFAIAALPGILERGFKELDTNAANYAKQAYLIADAMVEERNNSST